MKYLRIPKFIFMRVPKYWRLKIELARTGRIYRRLIRQAEKSGSSVEVNELHSEWHAEVWGDEIEFEVMKTWRLIGKARTYLKIRFFLS